MKKIIFLIIIIQKTLFAFFQIFNIFETYNL